MENGILDFWKELGENSKMIKQKDIDKVLNSAFWPENLNANQCLSIQHDDTDGEDDGNLYISIDVMGDVYISIDESKPLRFRSYFGGGKSLKVRNALVLLAEAIRQENNEKN